MSSERASGPEAVHPQEAVAQSIDRLFRRQATQMVATLGRHLGVEHLQLAEDAVQEALLSALAQWPYRGVPERPSGWLYRVARNRALDELRRKGNWKTKVDRLQHELPRSVEPSTPGLERELRDDQLAMIFACCHPSLSAESQLALTLKIACALSVDEISRALLSKESAVAQRIVRAKRHLRARNTSLEVPTGDAIQARLEVVLRVVYLLFNEGYKSTSGDSLVREQLSQQALRLAELLTQDKRTALPETWAVLALVNFQASRFSTRVDSEGDLLLIEHQDRSKWDQARVSRGLLALQRAASGDKLSSYHLEAEISACHALAETFEETDWSRMLDCYDLLAQRYPSPIVEVNRLVPLARVRGMDLALEESALLVANPRLSSYCPAWVARGELLMRAGQPGLASRAFARALEHCSNEVLKRHLTRRRLACEP